MIRMDLVKIIIQETSDHQIIVLKELDGERMFPILIGPYEAMAIDRRVKNIRAPRPLTHDLLNSTISSLGASLERIVINDLRDNTFFAKLVVRSNGQELEIDARPSDAIALALRAGAPIYVNEQVLAEAAESMSQMREDAEEIERFKDLMSDIDIPDIFPGSYRVPPEEKTEDEE